METTLEHGHVTRANGIDIHYLERGAGRPLLLLHGGLVSSSLRWAGVPVSYASHLDTLANRFRVIAPDTRAAHAPRTPATRRSPSRFSPTTSPH